MYVFTDGIIAGQEAVIGISTGVTGMIITGTQMHITFIFIAFFAHNQHHLGVGFIAHHTIDHHRTGFLQAVSQVEVFFFVKARTQFNNHGHFFAVTGSIHQSVHNF